MPLRPISLCVSMLLLLCGCGGSAGTVADRSAPDAVISPIGEIQGRSAVSPLVGKRVTIAGVVTGDFQGDDASAAGDLGGFFVQAALPDMDPTTSDGIFIVAETEPTVAVTVGDSVSISGLVREQDGETRIVADDVHITGTATVVPTDIIFPLPVTRNSDGKLIADLERYEGMLARFPQDLTLTSLFDLERFGEVSLAANGRRFQFTNFNPPDVDGYQEHQREYAATSVVLDDGALVQNASPVRYLYPHPARLPDYAIRIGDTVTGLVGNVRFGRAGGTSGEENYRIVPTAKPEFRQDNPRKPPPSVAGNLVVASFNLLNFFTTIDSGARICGPAGNGNCRGANSALEFTRQRDKIVSALAAIDADIVGLVELENNATESLTSIVDGLNERHGSVAWSFVDTGTIGTDAIRVGLIYKHAVVAATGTHAILDESVDARFLDHRHRPVLLQAFTQLDSGAVFSVAVTHLKSKGSSCASDNDPDRGDGQANCNGTRTRAARAMADWLLSDPTGSSDPDVLLIGDLNAYVMEDPLSALTAAGFTNLLSPAERSFQFMGQSGALDHALVSASLLSQVSGFSEWHINADEPPLFDYNLEFGRDADLFDGQSPYRASDHDPLIVGLSLTPGQE